MATTNPTYLKGAPMAVLLDFLKQREHLSESSFFRGTVEDLANELMASAPESEVSALPKNAEEWAEVLNGLRFHLIRFGYAFWPRNFTAEGDIRLYRRKGASNRHRPYRPRN